ncbi:MAG: GNAT family N-acetyltransferase [Alphaproteobacteria bacterium]|nr:GNAT family N-acetyltransferase [Alphaproteobacteria bacterium]MBO6628337.1 GNAT family N-acetyltransferase [Alphaproteobacteria bacterium]MDF1624724.1 GNAT family N-acetyltransferase [Parvibaculaceae bacterium]
MAPFELCELMPSDLERYENDLAVVLQACVANGASVGFVLPFSIEEAAAYWRTSVFPSVRQGGRLLYAAKVQGRVVATVHLVIDLLPNQRHRTEVSKLLVHPACRRGGIARALMMIVEEKARRIGRSLLTLDTRTGDHAELLYRSLGFQTAGILPGFALSADQDRFDATTYMYKQLPVEA